MRLKLKNVRGDYGANNDLILSYNKHQAAFAESAQATFLKIEDAISKTGEKGKMPLWHGYDQIPDYVHSTGPAAKRNISQVRTGRGICQFYAWLAAQKRPETILEFGAAFGASGMYWLAGLDIVGKGHLVSFEPNELWCAIARENFEAISDQFILTAGTFEDNLSLVTPKATITLIDAIHTKSVVLAQFELVKQVSQSGALVIFDDLGFSDDMWECWQEVCDSPDISSAWQIGNRVGIVELL
ncbi:MAG: class I SAM-dependent methyltransferase [Sulfitobacter sp.]